MRFLFISFHFSKIHANGSGVGKQVVASSALHIIIYASLLIEEDTITPREYTLVILTRAKKKKIKQSNFDYPAVFGALVYFEFLFYIVQV